MEMISSSKRASRSALVRLAVSALAGGPLVGALAYLADTLVYLAVVFPQAKAYGVDSHH